MPTPNFDRLAATLVRLRDEIKAREAAFEAELAPLRERYERAKSLALAALDAAHTESVRTAHGTLYRSTRWSASVADAEAFLRFVAANNAFDYLDVRANVTMAREHVERTGEPPPGVNLSALATLNVRRS